MAPLWSTLARVHLHQKGLRAMSTPTTTDTATSTGAEQCPTWYALRGARVGARQPERPGTADGVAR